MNLKIFKYINYREYLKQFYSQTKIDNPKFSYRSFAKKAGYSSPNLLQLIIKGERNLPNANILATCKALNLKKQEADYFELLVLYDQTQTHDEKDLLFKKLLRHPKFLGAKIIDKNKYRYFDHWYNPIIRELITAENYNNNPRWVVQRVYPRITISQVQNSIELMEKLKLIYRNESGKGWIQSDNLIQTPPEVSYLAAATYHKNMIQLSKNAIDNFSPEERDIRAITLKVSPKNYQILKKKMNDYWNEIIQLSAIDNESDMVYQVNFQVFPLTKKARGKS